MSKIGKNKKRCEKYKNSGHREINKQLKQDRHKKRMERFEQRKNDGKSYKDVHTKEMTENKVVNYCNQNGISEKDYLNNKEILDQKIFKANQGSNCARHTEVSTWKSIMRKVDNELIAKKNEDKKRAHIKGNNNTPDNE